MRARSRVPRPLAEFTHRRTWGELLYAVVGLFQGIFGFVFALVTLVLGTGLAVTFVGLPLIAASGLVCRWLGGGVRRGANLLIGADVPAPARFRSGRGLFGWLGSCLSDGTAWRARLYLLLKFPVGIAGFVVAAVFWLYGLGGLTYALWRPFAGCNRDPGDACHHGVAVGHHYVEHAGGIVIFTVVGALLLLAAPWVVRGVLQIDRLLIRALLGPTGDNSRVAELERTRAVAVDDSAATLRRIERDLHDGAQARLVTLAMNVGLAREKLAEGGDATALLDTAHASAKQAIAELRDLARGIHPPVIDAGLDAALATLTAHSTIPVALRVTLPERPDPSIETMAYFCVAELLANAGKHSGARSVGVEVTSSGGWLTAVVRDDGRGGAVIAPGSGLAGLLDRVATVDGRLELDSPAGGPTRVAVSLPLAVAG